MSENSPEPGPGDHGDATWADPVATQATADEAAGQPDRPPAVIDDLCRLTVCGPARTVELAVPVHVPLIDLLPALVGHLGEGLADAGLEHGGWVLQRLGDPPLRDELSVASLGLRDGDVVHLRPRADQLPPMDFDDLIDGVAVGISGRPDRWQPEMTRRLLTGLLAVPLAVGLVVLCGRLSPLADLIAWGVAAVTLVLAAAASRALGDRPAADVLGAAAIGYAGVAAAELPLLYASLTGPLPLTWVTLRPAVLAGGAVMAAVAGAVALLRGGRHPVLAGTMTAGLLVGAGGALATFARLNAAEVAAVVLAVVMPLGTWVPVLAFRLARMRLDPTPSTPEELQEDLDPVPGEMVLERTRLADRYMSALYAGLSIVATACLVILGAATGWPARLVALDAIVLLLLHSRVLMAARHRIAIVVPAVTGAAVLVAAAGLRGGPRTWPAVLAGLVAAAVLLLTAERSLPGQKVLPHWGRAGDLLQSLTAAALIPLVLWMLGLFEIARTVRG